MGQTGWNTSTHVCRWFDLGTFSWLGFPGSCFPAWGMTFELHFQAILCWSPGTAEIIWDISPMQQHMTRVATKHSRHSSPKVRVNGCGMMLSKDCRHSWRDGEGPVEQQLMIQEVRETVSVLERLAHEEGPSIEGIGQRFAT